MSERSCRATRLVVSFVWLDLIFPKHHLFLGPISGHPNLFECCLRSCLSVPSSRQSALLEFTRVDPSGPASGGSTQSLRPAPNRPPHTHTHSHTHSHTLTRTHAHTHTHTHTHSSHKNLGMKAQLFWLSTCDLIHVFVGSPTFKHNSPTPRFSLGFWGQLIAETNSNHIGHVQCTRAARPVSPNG